MFVWRILIEMLVGKLNSNLAMRHATKGEWIAYFLDIFHSKSKLILQTCKEF
jgi:hypothetical protein